MPKTIVEKEIVKLTVIKRQFMKISQGKIAEYLNVTRGYIGQIEMEDSNSMYSFDQLNKLAILLKCSPKDFMPEMPIAEQ